MHTWGGESVARSWKETAARGDNKEEPGKSQQASGGGSQGGCSTSWKRKEEHRNLSHHLAEGSIQLHTPPQMASWVLTLVSSAGMLNPTMKARGGRSYTAELRISCIPTSTFHAG